MPEKVIPFAQAPKPQHDAAEWHSRVTFQIGPQRYLFEFTSNVTRIPPTSATLIAIDRRETKLAGRGRRPQNRARTEFKETGL